MKSKKGPMPYDIKLKGTQKQPKTPCLSVQIKMKPNIRVFLMLILERRWLSKGCLHNPGRCPKYEIVLHKLIYLCKSGV